MKKILLIIYLLFLNSIPITISKAQNNSILEIDIEPEPLFNQLFHNETYTIEVGIQNVNITKSFDQPVEENPKLKYTGNVTIILLLKWAAKGSFDYGEGTTGYHINLEQLNLNKSIPIPSSGNISSINFIHIFEHDGFHFGIKPYETITITLSIEVYYQVYNVTKSIDQKLIRGKIAGWSKSFTFIDNSKIRYIEGKLKDLMDEVELLNLLPKTNFINKTKYLNLVNKMQSSLNDGDFSLSLKVYDKYADRDRLELIKSLISETNSSLLKAENTDVMINEIELWKTSYDHLENKYVILQNTYQDKLVELNNLKQNLTTAITSIFISSVIFFFLGRISSHPVQLPTRNDGDE